MGGSINEPNDDQNYEPKGNLLSRASATSPWRQNFLMTGRPPVKKDEDGHGKDDLGRGTEFLAARLMLDTLKSFTRESLNLECIVQLGLELT
jgi:hypothetical protein